MLAGLRAGSLGFLLGLVASLAAGVAPAELARSAPPAADATMARPLRFESVGVGIIPRDVVAALAQDRAGFLWIATGDGLVRYDGHFFRPQERESADPTTRNLGWIRAMLAARDGRLWIGTESQGLAVLDPTDGRITLPLAMGVASKAPMIQSLAEDPSGAIWVASMGDGLVRFDPASGRDTSYRHSGLAGSLPDDRVEAPLVDRAGVLWVGSWQGLSRRLPGSDVFEPVGPPGEAGLHGRTVRSLLQAKDGRIWVGTQQGDVAVFDPATGLVQRLSQAGGAVSSLLQAPDGPIWVGRDTGIDLFDAQGGQLLRRLVHDPASPEGLAGNQVHGLLLDRDGWIWIGGMGLGLQRHNPVHQSIWVHEMPPAPGEAARNSDVRSLLQLDSGEIWAATARGGVLVMDTQLRAIGTVPEVDRSAAARPVPIVVSAMEQQADGSVWLGTPSAIHQVSRERKPMRSLRHGAGNTNFLHTGSEGKLWVGTQDGLYLLQPGASTLQRVMLAGGRPWGGDVYAAAVAPDAGLWVGGAGGLFRIPPGASQAEPVAVEEGLGLGNPIVVGLLVDRRGSLWVDTAVVGLHRLQRWEGGRAAFERISARHGSVGRPFGASLLQDSRGRIWSHMHVYDPQHDMLEALSPADGARLGNGRFRVSVHLADGRMLFGGSKGLMVVTPETFERPSFAAPLVVTELRINGEPRNAGPALAGLSLAPEDRSFSLEFAALGYAEPRRVRYAFQLLGFDPQWVATDAEHRVAAYSNLPPGQYVLKVRAGMGERGWSPHELALKVQVLPAWWQTWVARAAGVLSLAALTLVLMHIRHRVLLSRQNKLEQLVQQRTASLEAVSQALQHKTAELEEASRSDPLTGLRNRRFLTDHIESDVALALRRWDHLQQQGLPPAEDADLIFFVVDIDHFKAVNDQHGHAAGDAVLRQMRGCLQRVFRVSDYQVRWGGEEFLIVALGSSRQQGPTLAERLRAVVADHEFLLDDGKTLRCTCSVGFACLPLDPQHARAVDWPAVVKLADAALYMAKDRGRNGWLGIVSAQAESESALMEWAGRPLQDWIVSGGVQIEAGP